MFSVKYLISFYSLTWVVQNSFAEEIFDTLVPFLGLMIYCVQVNTSVILYMSSL